MMGVKSVQEWIRWKRIPWAQQVLLATSMDREGAIQVLVELAEEDGVELDEEEVWEFLEGVEEADAELRRAADTDRRGERMAENVGDI